MDLDPFESLREDHRHIRAVLQSFEQELEGIRRENRPPDFALLGRTIQSFVLFVDGLHHAKELVLLRSLGKAVPPGRLAFIGRLMEEHAHGSEIACDLAEAVRAGSLDPAHLRELVRLGRQYVELQRTHSDFEDEQVFGLAERHLSPESREALARRFRSLDARSEQMVGALVQALPVGGPGRTEVGPAGVCRDRVQLPAEAARSR